MASGSEPEAIRDSAEIEGTISQTAAEPHTGAQEPPIIREETIREAAPAAQSPDANTPVFKDVEAEPPVFKDSLEDEQNISQMAEEPAVVEHAPAHGAAGTEEPARTETQRRPRAKRPGQDELPL